MRRAPSGSLRRRGTLALFVCLAFGLPCLAWGQSPIRSYLLQNAAAANASGLVAHAAGFSIAGVQIAHPAGATPTFTANFESSLNDIHYTATLCQPVGGTTLATTATAIGQWRCNVAGSAWFRARISGYSGAGAVTILATLLGSDPVIGLAENAPQGSQTVNQGGTWTIQASHQGGQWNIDKVSHVTSVMAHVIGTVTIEGRGSAGTSAGGVVSVQGVASGTALAASASQSGTWTIQAAHQGGSWTLAHVTSVTHVAGVVDRPSYTQAHLFSTIGLGSTVAAVNGPVKSYTIQAAITRGTSASWYVHLQGSLDGNSFTSIVKHEQSSGDGQAVFSGATLYPARYLRVHLTGFSGDGLLSVHVMGMS